MYRARRDRRRACGVWSLALAAMAMSSPAASAAADSVLATYRGGTISESDVTEWSRFVELDSGRSSRLDLRAKVEEIVILRTLAGYFERSTAASSPEFLARRSQVEQRTHERLLRRHLVAAAEPTPEEIAHAYEQRLGLLRQPRKWRLEDLFKAFPPGADDVDRARTRQSALTLRERLVAGEDFAELARRESDSSTRLRGGASSPVPLDRLAPELARVVEHLEVGDISPVVELPLGVVVVRVAAVIPERVPTLAEVGDQLRAGLRATRFEESWTRTTDAGLDALQVRMADWTGPEPPAVVATWRDGADGRREILMHELHAWAEETDAAPPAAPSDRAWIVARVRELAELEVHDREAARLGLTTTGDAGLLRRWSVTRLEAQLAANELSRPWLSEPGDEAVLATYTADPAAWVEPRQRRLQLLRVAIDRELSPASLDALRTLGRDAAAACRDLGELTAPASSGAEVVELGWLTDREVWGLGLNVQAAVDALSCGACSPLIQENRWLVVVRLAECRPLRQLSLAEARPRIVASVLHAARRRAGATIRERVLAEQAIAIAGP